MTDDVVARAKAALEGVTAGPWLYIPGDDEEDSVVISEGEKLPDAITVGGITFNPGYSVAVDLRNGDAAFFAECRSLVPELVAELERLRAATTGLVEEWKVFHESGGGSIHGTYESAKELFDAFVERPPGVEDPGSGRLTHIAHRFVSTPWVPVDGSGR